MKTNQSLHVSRGVKNLTMLLGVIIVIFSLLPVAYSEVQTLPTTKINTCIELAQTCANCTYVNLTIVKYPNTTSIIIGKLMNRNGVNYKYNFCDTSQIGDYVVTTCGDVDGVLTCVNYDFNSGAIFGLPEILIYLLFLSICLGISIYSFRLTKKNPMQKDELKGQQMYELKKRSEWKFYIELIKRKMWIVGLFGIYLSIMLFVSLSSNLLYNLGLTDLFSVLSNISIVLLWGSIPFVIFWIVYVILIFFKGTKDAMTYQYGSFRSSR